jgi:hypothetical protein
MSHVIPISKVNQFLPVNKLELDTSGGAGGLPVDHPKIADFEETARGIILSKLRPLYDTTGWLVPTAPNQLSSAPELVHTIAGMLVAGWVYDRQFADQVTEGDSYGARKVREAYALLAGIVDGTYDLDVDLLPELDTVGFPLVHETEPVFTMDMRP